MLKESNAHLHSGSPRNGLRFSVGLFIASEVMFFVAFFWAFFNSAFWSIRRSPQWPPRQDPCDGRVGHPLPQHLHPADLGSVRELGASRV